MTARTHAITYQGVNDLKWFSLDTSFLVRAPDRDGGSGYNRFKFYHVRSDESYEGIVHLHGSFNKVTAIRYKSSSTALGRNLIVQTYDARREGRHSSLYDLESAEPYDNYGLWVTLARTFCEKLREANRIYNEEHEE